MIKAILPFLALLSSYAAYAQEDATEGAAAPPGPQWDMIRFEVKSWGGPVTWWQFTPEYGGVWAENISDPGVSSGTYTLAFHPLEADVDRYIALETLMRRLPEPAPDSDDCKSFMPDQAYGILRLSRGATTTEIAWNSGCMDESYAEFIALLHEADTMVSEWASEVPVSRTEVFTQ